MNGIIYRYLEYGISYVKFSETKVSYSLINTAFISFHWNITAFDMEFTATEGKQRKLIKDG